VALLGGEDAEPLGATCDLPGDARRLAVWGDRLVVAAGGTLFLLER